MAKKPVASGNGMIPKATAMNPHAKGSEGTMMPMPGGKGYTYKDDKGMTCHPISKKSILDD